MPYDMYEGDDSFETLGLIVAIATIVLILALCVGVTWAIWYWVWW